MFKNTKLFISDMTQYFWTIQEKKKHLWGKVERVTVEGVGKKETQLAAVKHQLTDLTGHEEDRHSQRSDLSDVVRNFIT